MYIPVYHVDMCPLDYRQRSNSLQSNGYPSLNFFSLPQVPSVANYTMVQRSFSFGSRPTKRSDSHSRSQNRSTAGLNHVAKRQRPNYIHPTLQLMHSNSAPAIGGDPWRRRRHSYGSEEVWGIDTDTELDGINPRGKSLLRRTSSEVYVDRGE